MQRYTGSEQRLREHYAQRKAQASLLQTIEKFLLQENMAATTFGRLCRGDPRFVLDLRNGRTPREGMEDQTRDWMKAYVADYA